MRRVLPMKLLLAVLLAACVTVNVYFPAAAVEQAADQFIRSVTEQPAGSAQPQGSNQPKPQGSILTPKYFAPVAPAVPAMPNEHSGEPSLLVVALGTVLEAVVPAVHAQSPNIEINTPETRAINASMKARFGQLKPYIDSGAVGFTSDGHVAVRDANAVPLAERATVKTLVAQDNSDRDALYAEIAKANGHPEWKSDIQSTFARRWIDLAAPGTWYQDGGAWKQK